MRFLAIATLIGALALNAAPTFAAMPQPPSDIMANVQTFLAITEGKSSVDIDSLFSPDAVVIDESAPYRWNGSHAASAWLAHVNGLFVKMHMSKFTAIAGRPIEYSQTRDLAYLIVPLALSGRTAPKPFHETGAMTFTFHRTAGDWKIATAVWTTATK